MSKQKLNARQLRWTLFLADYNFRIQYKEGRLMGKADALSRRQEYTDVLMKEKETERLLLNHDRVDAKIFEEMEDLRSTAEEHQSGKILQILFLKTEPTSCFSTKKMDVVDKTRLLNKIKATTKASDLFNKLLEPPMNQKTRFILKNELIYLDNRIVVVDKSCQMKIMCLLHDDPRSGHFGSKKTTHLIQKEFYWEGMAKAIESYVKSCDLCQRGKRPKHKPYGLLNPLPIPNGPWMDIGMDFVGPLPESNSYNLILVVICRLTKLAHFIPCQDTINTAQLIRLFQDNIFRLHGYPQTIVSDRGTLFTSKYWQMFAKTMKSKHNLSTAHHQQTDGITERVIQTLKQYLRMYINYRMNDWSEFLSSAEFAYNNSPHSTTSISPFKATYGYDFKVFQNLTTSPHPCAKRTAEELDRIHKQLTVAMKKAQTAQKLYADKLRRSPPNFNVGDKVWLLTTNLISQRPNKSLDFKRVGPLEILVKLPHDNFKVKLPIELSRMHDTFHVSLLEPFYANTFEERNVPPPPPVTVSEGDASHVEYEVDYIADCRIVRNKVEYLIHWKGYGLDERLWVPQTELPNAREAIDSFHMAHPNLVRLPETNTSKKRKLRRTRPLKRVKQNSQSKVGN